MAVAITVASALIVVTCNVGRDRTPPPAPPIVSPLDTLAAAASAAPPIELPTALPSAAAPPAPSASASALPAGARPPGHELDRFYAALRGLAAHTRKEHVRVAWFGDSHGASDLWSGPLREALQARFGAAGPGFLHLGYKSYRHEGVKVDIRGRWAPRPKGPSTIVHTADGVFGLGGVLLLPSTDGPQAALTLTDTQLPNTLTWDICTKFGSARDEVKLALTGQPEQLLKPAPNEALGKLRHLTLQSTGVKPALKATPLGGQPGFCGVVVETDPATRPGVVLDTLGINGARLATILAWDEAAWVAEASRRKPQLVILEYGTNESGDTVIKAASYVENLKKVMARVRAASPECDCLVLSPTDRADTPDRTPQVRDALKEAAKVSGCGFWDTYDYMGGRGSINAWKAESPPRAAPDGVHLHPRGYRELGEELSKVVLGGYGP